MTKFVFIRGLPGTGKSKVVSILREIFLDSETIHVDSFKLIALKKKMTFENAQKYAYQKALETVSVLPKDKIVFIDDLMIDEGFYSSITKLTKTSETYWFRLMRPLSTLLKIEKSRKRAVKNSKKDFDKLKAQLESINVPGEIRIKNDSLRATVLAILQSISP